MLGRYAHALGRLQPCGPVSLAELTPQILSFYVRWRDTTQDLFTAVLHFLYWQVNFLHLTTSRLLSCCVSNQSDTNNPVAGSDCILLVIPSKRSLRSEESGRAA